MESTPESVELLLTNCKDDLLDIPYVQSAGDIRGHREFYAPMNMAMIGMLDKLVGLQIARQ